MSVKKAQRAKRVMRVIRGPFISKEYADGACFAFEKAARFMSWSQCKNCQNAAYVKCLSPEKCTVLGFLHNRFKDYIKSMKKAATNKQFALACGCRPFPPPCR
jgi:hypothetical protein